MAVRWVLLCIALLLIYILFFLRLRFKIESGLDQKHVFKFDFRIAFIRLKYEAFLSADEEGIFVTLYKNGKPKNIYRLYELFGDLNNKKERYLPSARVKNRFLKALQIDEFNFSALVGIERDACETALWTGRIQAILSAALAPALYRFIIRPNICIRPDYKRNIFCFELRCIARLHVGKSIIASIILFIDSRKERKKRLWHTQLKTS